MVSDELNKGAIAILTLVAVAVLVIISIVIFVNLRESFPQETLSDNETILADNGTTTALAQTPTSLTATMKNTTWLSFDGVNDEVEMITDLNIDSPRNLTYLIWVNTSKNDGLTRTVIEMAVSIERIQLLNGKFFLDTQNDSFTNFDIEITGANDSSWHQIAFLYNNETGNITSYLDGSVFNTTTIGVKQNYLQTKINLAESSTDFSGFLDELRIYNRTLTTSEISQIYNSGRVANSSLPTTGLVLWLPLNENQGTDVHSFNQTDFA